MLPRPYLKVILKALCDRWNMQDHASKVSMAGFVTVCAIIEQSEWFDKFKAKKVFLELSLLGQTCSQVTSLNLPASVTC